MTRREPKSSWYTTCRHEQESWKASTPTLPQSAKRSGTTWVEGKGGREEVGPFPICLPTTDADLNLLPGIRDEALRRFARHGIHWHAWTPNASGSCLPSTHLLDSQVQCVNVLLTLANNEGLVLDLVRQIEPDAADPIVVEDGSPVAFEWIGSKDYLGEGRGSPRHRGRFATSVDALIDEVWHSLLPGPTVSYACVDTTPLFMATPELAERYGALAR